MRKLIQIQSFSDVITNSSSAVFLMHEEDGKSYERMDNPCIDITPVSISKKWLLNHSEYWDMFLEHLNLTQEYMDKPVRGDTREFDSNFIDKHSLEFQRLKDLCVVEIEDHFDDYLEVMSSAKCDCLSWESWH